MKKVGFKKKVFGTKERLRVCVYKSLRALYAQVIDDTKGNTCASASVLGKKNTDAGKELAEKLASVMKDKGIKKVCFDVNGRKYHGVLKVFADGLRERGIDL